MFRTVKIVKSFAKAFGIARQAPRSVNPKFQNKFLSQTRLNFCTTKNPNEIVQEENQESIQTETQEPVQAEKQQTIEKFESEQLDFKAETKKLLNIVAKSLYTDKDVFLRELLSNSSDALEKQRYYVLTGQDTQMADELKISLITDEAKRQIIIQDSGVGMTKEELIDNLGTIARSGSKNFIESIGGQEGNNADNIIGQFGVGFYSSFIVGDTVEVISKAAKSNDAYLWVSDGSGKFEISRISQPGFERGTKIIIHLRPDCAQFSRRADVQKVIQRYSNFINFPILLNGEKINLISAIWSKSKSDLNEDDYTKFWEYIANTKVPYKYKLHYSTDVPLSIKSLLYIPSSHMEKFGISQEDMSVHLYSRKVLIKQNCRELLPNWLRFVKGVVDCEDIPLNISRENYQDSALMGRLKLILTKRIIKLLEEESRKNPEQFLTWYNDFQWFIKEGLAMDPDNQESLLGLSRYNANFTDELITLDDYHKKIKPSQDKIYYLLASNKEQAENSPYMEPFRGTDIPVLYLTVHIDEMVFRSLSKYKDLSFVNIETNYDEIAKDIKSQEHDVSHGIPEDDVTPFCLWVKNELQPVIGKVQISKRLTDSPAIVVSQLSTGMRQVMNMMEKNQVMDHAKNLTFEINPNHELIVKLNQVRKSDSRLASTIIHQLLDNSLVTTGLLFDSKGFINRINKLVGIALNSQLQGHLNPEQEAQREIEAPISEQDNKQNNTKEPEIIIDSEGNPKIK